jgi:hypothetical protein
LTLLFFLIQTKIVLYNDAFLKYNSFFNQIKVVLVWKSGRAINTTLQRRSHEEIISGGFLFIDFLSAEPAV